MKLVYLFMLATVGLLTACGPPALPGAPTLSSPTDQPTPPPTEEAKASPTATALSIKTAPDSPLATPTEEPGAMALHSPEATPSPEPAGDVGAESEIEPSWNTDPDALIILATFCCGYTTDLVPVNYIPDALVWGDGRIIWVQSGEGGERRVLEGYLTPDQMRALLQRVVDAGFFGWQDKYANLTIADAAEKCLSVQLESQSKKVCEYAEGAPQAFHDLYAHLADGAGATGSDYVPETGYLTAYPLDLSNQPAPEADQWSAASLGLPLSEAVAGVWVEGEALKLAWNVVNANPWGMVVQDGDAYYRISLQIPGVSQMEPPAR
jgi:hypothetical protein